MYDLPPPTTVTLHRAVSLPAIATGGSMEMQSGGADMRSVIPFASILEAAAPLAEQKDLAAAALDSSAASRAPATGHHAGTPEAWWAELLAALEEQIDVALVPLSSDMRLPVPVPAPVPAAQNDTGGARILSHAMAAILPQSPGAALPPVAGRQVPPADEADNAVHKASPTTISPFPSKRSTSHTSTSEPSTVPAASERSPAALAAAIGTGTLLPAPGTPMEGSAAQPLLNAALPSPVATAPPIASTAGPTVQAGHGLDQMIDRLLDAHQAGRSAQARMTVAHADFGPVGIRFEQAGAAAPIQAGSLAPDIAVTLSSADPDFAAAIQAGLAERAACDRAGGDRTTDRSPPSTDARHDGDGRGPADDAASHGRQGPGERSRFAPERMQPDATSTPVDLESGQHADGLYA